MSREEKSPDRLVVRESLQELLGGAGLGNDGPWEHYWRTSPPEDGGLAWGQVGSGSGSEGSHVRAIGTHGAQPQGTTRWNPKGGATMPAPSHGTDVLLKLQGELLPHSSLCFYSFFPSSRQAQMTPPVFPSLHDFHYLWLMSPCRYSLLLTRSRPVATPESSWGLGLPSTPSSLEAVSVLWILCKVTCKSTGPGPFLSLSQSLCADRLRHDWYKVGHILCLLDAPGILKIEWLFGIL